MANRARTVSVIVMDTGPSTARLLPNGSTFLEQAKKTVTSILQRKIFSESKDEFALVLFGTNNTDNNLSGEDGHEYCNIVEARSLDVVNWHFMQVVKDIKQGRVGGDFLDAIVVALDCLNRDDRKVLGRRLVVISNFSERFSRDQLEEIVIGTKTLDISMTVIGTDLAENLDGDHLFGKTEGGDQTKTKQQKYGEAVVRDMLEKIDGAAFSFSEVEPALQHFERRQVKPFPWKVNLEIGDSLDIPVILYSKIAKFTMKSWKQSYSQDKDARVISERSYHKNDEAQTECSKDDVIEAYRYGSTLVPFNAEDKANMAYQSSGKSFAVLAFCKQDCILRHLFLGTSVHQVYADHNDEYANRALSAFIQALYETGMVAIVRYCYSARSVPKIGFIAPRIRADLQCLTFIQIPFMEDLRLYTFPSLDANPKIQPNAEQLSVMDDLITAMDLTKKGSDGKLMEQLKPKHTLNPLIQYSYKCLLHRGLDPKCKLPEVDPEIAATFVPPKEFNEACEPIAKKMKQLFTLTRVEQKKKDKVGTTIFEDKTIKDEPAESASGDTIPGGICSLTRDAVMEVGTSNPRNDFVAIIRRDPLELEIASKQLEKIVVKLAVETFAGIQRDEYHRKALDGLEVLRAESVKDRATQFNDFMVKLKESLCRSDKIDFWEKIVEKKIGLIADDEAPKCGTSLEARQAFFTIESKAPAVAPSPPPGEDADDLLDMM